MSDATAGPTLDALLDATANPIFDALQAFLRMPSLSGSEGAFTRFVADWAGGHGFVVDLWQADERDLGDQPEATARHLPLAGRPTLVIKLPGTGGGRSLVFNAHADVVAAGEESAWMHGPWSGDFADGNLFGRGACDVKGPLASALWAMLVMKDQRPAGDLLLELVPGEEDCVGLGTLTSVARGYRADASIVLEPTEGVPRCASRGGMRFDITLRGHAVHGTVKWLGRDAITLARRTLDALDHFEADHNDRRADPLFSAYPIARSVTVDTIHGGEWQGMVCDRCTIGGYLELLPTDDPEAWTSRFAMHLKAAWGDAADDATLSFSERYGGHRLEPTNPLCVAAERAYGSIGHPIVDSANAVCDHRSFTWQGFNSGCEAGLRPRLHGTPTLVWGPGSLAQAHAADEFVAWDDVRRTAARFVALAGAWCVKSDVSEARDQTTC